MLLLCCLAIGRAFAGALALALLFAAGGEAAAQSPRQKPLAPKTTVASPASPAAPIRFFTINEVLARHGMQADPVYRLAHAGNARVLNDASADAPAAGPEPFGLYGFRAPEGRLWKNWRALEAAMKTEAATVAACIADGESCPAEAALFLALADEVRGKSGRARLEAVNRLANKALRYTTDLAQHGEADRWSAPLASLASLRGDCEDYAILKYALLREAGVAAERLRILLVRDSAGRQDHAVLAVAHEDQWLVLDNLRPAVMQAAELPHYTPLYGLGHEGVTMLATRYASLDELGLESAQFAPATSGWNMDGDSAGEDARAAGGYETLVF